MNPATVREDIAILKRHGIPLIPTTLLEAQRVSYAEETRRFYRRVFEGSVEAGRSSVMRVHDHPLLVRARQIMAQKLERPIAHFRKLYTHVVGREFIDVVADFMRTERFSFMTRKRTQYVLEQPLFAPSHPLTYGDLLNNPVYRELLLRCIVEGEAMLSDPKEQRGLDLLGGKAFKLVPGALKPWQTHMYAEVSNLMVAEADVSTPHEWKGFEPSTGIFAKKGDVRLVDSGLFKLATEPGILGKVKTAFLRTVQDFQNGALWALLETFEDYTVPEEHFKTLPRKIARWLMKRAATKMRAYAKRECDQ